MLWAGFYWGWVDFVNKWIINIYRRGVASADIFCNIAIVLGVLTFFGVGVKRESSENLELYP